MIQCYCCQGRGSLRVLHEGCLVLAECPSCNRTGRTQQVPEVWLRSHGFVYNKVLNQWSLRRQERHWSRLCLVYWPGYTPSEWLIEIENKIQAIPQKFETEESVLVLGRSLGLLS